MWPTQLGDREFLLLIISSINWGPLLRPNIIRATAVGVHGGPGLGGVGGKVWAGVRVVEVGVRMGPEPGVGMCRGGIRCAIWGSLRGLVRGRLGYEGIWVRLGSL